MDHEIKPSFMERISSYLTNEPLDRRELLDVLNAAYERKLLDAEALSIIQGALEMGDLCVRDVMVPRSQMQVIQLDMPVEEIANYAVSTGHSRFPAVNGSKDDVQGILHAKDLLRYFADQVGSLAALLRPVVFVPETQRINVLLRDFRANRNHMAIVVDEYGGVAGLITIEDVLEEIVGEIEDEHDQETPGDHIRRTLSGGYRVRAITRIDEFNAAFQTQIESEDFDTVGGLLIHHLGHLPQRGETLQVEHLRIRVSRADSRRIHDVYVEPVKNEGVSTHHD